MLDLTGKKALVTGIANNKSIAWGIAQQLHAAGAEIGVTYLPDDRGRAEGKVKKLTEPLNPTLFLPCNVQDDDQVNTLFDTVKEKWDSIDILIHSLAYANAKDLMPEGGSIGTLTYLGGVRVVPNYNVMGVAKAALEMSVRYLAADLGPQNIRVNGISAGPIRTLASSAIGGILDMIHHVEEVAPLRRTVTQTEVGNTATFLSSDLASGITGQVVYVDSGYATMGM